MEGLPVFQNRRFPDEDSARACPSGGVALVQDMETGLVFNSAFEAARLEYGGDYQNEQACSGVFQEHLGSVLEIIRRHFHGRRLVEIGCGKGYFLESLRKAGFAATGVDPAYEGDSPGVIRASFDARLGLSAGGAVLRHVLEHVADPLKFLAGVRGALGGGGLVYIEAPCFARICARKAWFDISYEHVNYFRLADLRGIFGTVLESGHLFGGQYIYAVADLGTLRRPLLRDSGAVAFPPDFLSGIGRIAARAGERSTAVWGGASKGVICSLLLERAGVRVRMAVDIDPAKQGKYLAASGLRVNSPEEALKSLRDGDNMLVMNSNYLEEIVRLSRNRFNYIKADNDGF